MKTISIENKNFIVKIPYDIDIVNLIKARFSGRSWDPDKKAWKVAINSKNLEIVQQFITEKGFEVTSNTLTELENLKNKLTVEKKEGNEIIEMSKAVSSNLEIKGIKGELFPYQKAGVAFIEKTNGKTLLADEMGLGKTLQALAWCQLNFEKRPILVICPATLKINWKRECEKWTSLKSYIINSSDNSYQMPCDYDSYIINYDILEKKKELLQKLNFKIMILDEAHYTKNPKTIRTKAVIEMSKSIPHVLALTGTPILNRPIEIYNILKMLNPEIFGNYWEFAKKYCGLVRTRWGIDVTGASNIDELAEKLRSSIMIRREKKDVLKDLPDKLRIVIPQEIDLKEYKKAEDDLINYLIENKNKSIQQAERINQVEQLARIEYCKQEAIKAKLPVFVEWVKDFVDGNGKLVIFAHHIEFIEKLMTELKDYSPMKIIGGMQAEDKQKSIDTFMQDKNCKIIICSIKAAGVGITLTSASHVAFLELGWTPGDHDQAEDRLHRIGQKDNVSCYYFLAQGTIEENIYNLIQEKRKIFTQLMQDQNIVSEEKQNIFGDLINQLIQK